MMPGNVSLRTVRVEQTFTNDKEVLANRARDKVISMLNEEKKRKVDQQRRGLSLAELFAKPSYNLCSFVRCWAMDPVWMLLM